MSTTRRSAEAAESILARIREWAENPNKTDNPYREGFSDAKRSVLTLLAGESPRSSNPLADQDHGLDDVRELARGLRENENPGETREGVRVEHVWVHNRSRSLPACEICGQDIEPGTEYVARTDKLPLAHLRCFFEQVQARADRLEAALKEIGGLDGSGFTNSDGSPYTCHECGGPQTAREALIEHGPDDGESERCTCGPYALNQSKSRELRAPALDCPIHSDTPKGERDG